MRSERDIDLKGRRRFMSGISMASIAASLGWGPGRLLAQSAMDLQRVPEGATVDVRVEIEDHTVGKIEPGFIGLSYEKNVMSSNTLSAHSRNNIGLYRLLGKGVLRIGANQVDKVLWDPKGKGGTAGIVGPADLKRLVEFVRATGWKVIYGVNMQRSTPARSASEAFHAVQALGSSLIGIEIGNEPDFFHLDKTSPMAAITADQYVRLYGEYVKAILKFTPNAPLVGPALGMHMEWLDAFLAAKFPNMVLHTVHYYTEGSNSSDATINRLLHYPPPGLPKLLSDVGSRLGQRGIPYRIDECNSFAGGGVQGVSNSCASSLWALQYLFSCAMGPVNGVNFHCNYRPTGYTPMSFDSNDATGVQPEFYGILMFALAGNGVMKKTNLTGDKGSLTAFTVATDTGGMNVVLVNKDEGKNARVELSALGPVGHASLIAMTNPGLADLSGTRIQGSSVGADGSFKPRSAYELETNGTKVTCFVPAKSAVLVKIA